VRELIESIIDVGSGLIIATLYYSYISFRSLECILQFGKALTLRLYLCVYRCLDLGYGGYFLGGSDKKEVRI
jgi:hypothetical protein